MGFEKNAFAIIAVCGFFVAGWGIAQERPSYATPLTELNENLAPAAKVSNDAVIVAILEDQTFYGGAKTVDGEFEIFVPNKSQICITYHTRNGLYEGKQFFASETTGWVRVHYQSANRHDLLEYGRESFAVRALVTESCDKPARSAPLTIVRSVDAGKDFFVIVHADGQPASIAVYAKGARSAIAEESCQLFNDKQSVRFDRKCKLPPEAFMPGTRTALLRRLPGELRVHRLRVVQSDELYAMHSSAKR